MDLKGILGRRPRIIGALLVAATGAGMAAPAAHAGLLAGPASCASSATSQAFSQWGDSNDYELAPGGNFASANSGWTLTGGAKIVTTQVPFDIGGAKTVGALYMPPGSTAQSPTMCVNPADPTYRFLGYSTGGSNGLSSQAIYTEVLGLRLALALNSTRLQSSWGPAPAETTGAAPGSLLSLGAATMSLRFQSSGYSIISDVYVDPRMHG